MKLNLKNALNKSIELVIELEKFPEYVLLEQFSSRKVF